MDANAPNSKRRSKTAERSKQAVNLRIAGATFEQIGERLEISTPSAFGLVSRALLKTRAATAESAETLRQMELTRLDAMQTAIWADAMKGDEQKIDRLLKIQARRAALLGLDAPTKVAPTDPTGERGYEALTDAERAARLASILEAARTRLEASADG